MQTSVVLPDGCTVRAPEASDAKAIFRLLAAYNTAVVGFADRTLAQVRDDLIEPGFEPGTDGWLVLADDGLPVGYGWTYGKAERREMGIGVTSPVPGVAAWLYDRTMQRAREMGRECGQTEIVIDAFVYRDDQASRALLAENAFTIGTTYQRMRIDHAGSLAAPDVPAGVVVRRGAPDDATRWTAHELIIDCFTGQFGFTPRPHEEWLEARELNSLVDWSMLTVLELGGQAVAFRDCSDLFAAENCGHIASLGVAEGFRGRGLAKFLLRDAFALDAAAGRVGTTLLVDTNNPTPALDLYLSVGMTPTLTEEGWRLILPTT
jgi:ribosomal protein S18 acetylase RimI-like enzyme